MVTMSMGIRHGFGLFKIGCQISKSRPFQLAAKRGVLKIGNASYCLARTAMRHDAGKTLSAKMKRNELGPWPITAVNCRRHAVRQ